MARAWLAPLWGVHSPMGHSYLIPPVQADPQGLLPGSASPASPRLFQPLWASPGLFRPCCHRWRRLVSQAAASQTADSKMRGLACSRPKPSGAILPESPCFSSCREEERKQSSDSGSRPPPAFCTLLGNRRGLVAEWLQGLGSPQGGRQAPAVALSDRGHFTTFFLVLEPNHEFWGNRNVPPQHTVMVV